MKSLAKNRKKKVVIICVIFTIIATSMGTWYAMEQNYKTEVLASIDLIFKDDAFIEYGQETVDYNEFIDELVGEPEVTLPTDDIDTKVLETKEFIYKLSKDGYSKDISVSIEIKDTQALVITLKEETVTLEYGTDYNIKENIESVSDSVDGEIAYVEEAGENNYYTIEDTLDVTTAGDYTITIKAVDKNGMEATKEYIVHVNEEVKEEPQEKLSGSDKPYTPPTNNNGSDNKTPPISNNNPPAPPDTCVANGQWKSVGNSGVAFYTWEEADAYGSANVPDGFYYGCITVHDICGKIGWSPSFKPFQS